MLAYILRGFEEGDSIGAGTTSDADWACQGEAKNVQFCVDSSGRVSGLGTSRKVLSEWVSLAQA